MIFVENLTLKYAGKTVLDGVTVSFPDHGAYAIMGKSGCGKTTLFKAILGIRKNYTGTVRTDGEKIRAVFQEDRLLEDRNAVDNLVFVAQNGKKEKDEIIKFLSGFDLGDGIYLPCSELSGGMRRRVALARALYSAPDVLLLDEPFNALDEATKAQMIRKTADFAKDHTVIVITHSAEEAEALGAKVIGMDKGKIIE